MLDLATSIGYSIVESSWHTAAFLAKFYLIFTLGRLKFRDRLDLENFEDAVLVESRLFVGLIVFIGVLSLIAGLEIRPQLPLISELVALIYFGFLFWKF